MDLCKPDFDNSILNVMDLFGSVMGCKWSRQRG